MADEQNQIVFASPLLRVEKTCCQRARRGLSCEECKDHTQIAVPLSGVNVHHLGRETYTTSPTHITLSNRGDPYRVSHPYGSGETQLTIVPKEQLLIELLAARDPAVVDRSRPFARHQLPISTKSRLALQLLVAASQARAHSKLEVEEAFLEFLETILAGLAMTPSMATNRRDGVLARDAQSLLANRYAQEPSLESLAEELGVSSFHLCRVYKRVNMTTIGSDLRRLRVCGALLRLGEGERDLTALGLSLGFSHHSHFTSSFRSEVGLTPSAARTLLASGSLSQIRRLFVH